MMESSHTVTNYSVACYIKETEIIGEHISTIIPDRKTSSESK